MIGKLCISQEWVLGNGELFSSTNPANNELLWEGNAASAEQVDAAVRAARQALLTWQKMHLDGRYQVLKKFNDIVQSKAEELAVCISQETGKPLWESQAELNGVIGKLAISKEAYLTRCKLREENSGDFISATRHKPHGVVAVFGPFNFPAHLPNGHIMPALLAGNTVVFKASELTPKISEVIMQCWLEAGIPAGVLNLLQGGRETGKALFEHRNIDGIFFTGSYHTGHLIQSHCLQRPNRIVALELGGNNPLVIDSIQDLQAAAYQTIQSAYITAGQRCTCARRLIVIKNDKNIAFVNALQKMMQSIQIGRYDADPQPFIGSVISSNAADSIMQAYQALISEGAEVLMPLQRLDPNTAFLRPGLIDVTQVTNRLDEEIFGPLLQLIWVRDLDEAIAEANHTSYGLSAGILTDQKSHYHSFYERVRAGIINWNKPITGASSAAPFGGLGKSGNYRPSAYYAADYCAYPVASVESEVLVVPEKLTPGIEINAI